MFTPAISASSTSVPSVIIAKAFSTQVFSPPFLNLLPLADAMTTGLTPPLTTAGAWLCAEARVWARRQDRPRRRRSRTHDD